ncbi:sigma-54 interaction domain-containing protein [Desulfatiglans anilini]|uniref:sigma-54 interaction domain-containing protein n=1 Tax=Desulfatiglans anilini TaxID=90728 RepID=UPI0004135D74|nr:sigma-54-dependent Fis family transcriptional regulator [Desulfatiglans anilini]
MTSLDRDSRGSDLQDFESATEMNLLKEKFQNIFENALGALFVVNKEGIVEYANKKYLEIFRVTKEEVIGKKVPQDCRHGFDYVLQTGESIIGQIYRSSKRLTIINKIAIKENQKIIGAVGIALFDKLEELEKLKKKIFDLEEKVGQYKRRLDNAFSSKYTFKDIIGDSRVLHDAKNLSVKAANTSLPVLIVGESGTGKELFAHSIHHKSARLNENFVRVNCAAIPKDLFEAELFGYEPGAFTGALRDGKLGKFELAHNGTIFLDEICEMPLEMQSKLLRVIQEKEVERVGGKESKNIDFRLIAATNRDINSMVDEGKMREDLYYRLNVIKIFIAPLRERKEDIPMYVDYFLNKISEKQCVKKRAISRCAVNKLMAYDWPGNVRELKNIIELAAISVKESDVIKANDLPEFQQSNFSKVPIDKNFLRNVCREAERRAIEELLIKTDYSVSKAADMIGIHRTGLYRKIKTYKINFEKRSNDE